MISIECFKGLPVEYEYFLIEKYESFITTCRYIEVYYPSYEINYMLVFEKSNLMELLVFGNKGKISICLNSLANIDQMVISECSKMLFEEYPSIQKLKIEASYLNYNLKKSLLFFKSDDQILNLPLTMDEYFLGLGSSTRQTIKNRRVKLFRDYPDVQFITKFGTEIEESIINKIIKLKNENLKNKGIASKNITADNLDIYKYSKSYGCVSYIEIDGALVAGSINTILNKGIFGHVTVYDRNFSKYKPGEICALNLIQTSIEKGLSTFHFLWGENDLKKRLQAKPHLLFSYFIYRAYSLNYYFDWVKIIYFDILNRIKHSKISKPLRNIIKSFRCWMLKVKY